MIIDPKNFSCLQTVEQIDAWLKLTADCPVLSFDTEATGLVPFVDKIVGVSMAGMVGDVVHSCYIPIGHTANAQQVDPATLWLLLEPHLTSSQRPVVLHNAVFDIVMMRACGVPFEIANVEDSMFMSYALSGMPKESFSHGMDALALRELGWTTIKFAEVVNERLGHRHFGDVDLRPATMYAAEDSAITLALYYVLDAKLDAAGLKGVYTDIDKPLIRALADMKFDGVTINVDLCEKLTREWTAQIAKLQKKIDKQAGRPVKLGSPIDLSKLLFDEMGLEPGGFTDAGKPSTSKFELEAMGDVPIVKDILEWRKFSKLVSTYTAALPEKINAATGRVHANFPATRTSTGRFASNDPNLQNISTRTKEGSQVRAAFIGRQRHLFGTSDYSQIELRVAAHNSGDPVLVKAYRDDVDVHALTAATISKVAIDKVTKPQRDKAKTTNFLSLFGGAAFQLARSVSIPIDEADDFIYAYWDNMKGLADYIEDVKEVAREVGYGETLFGRRAKLPFIKSANKQLRQHHERLSVSVAVQGTAADLMRLAIPQVRKYLIGVNGRLLATVHDELCFEFPDKLDGKKICNTVADIMAHAADDFVDWSVPIKANANFGKNWNDAK